MTAAEARPASGFYGVSASGKQWKACLYYGRKTHSLGTFDTKEQAAHAYDQAARAHKKEAPLNFRSAEEEAAELAGCKATLLSIAAAARC